MCFRGREGVEDFRKPKSSNLSNQQSPIACRRLNLSSLVPPIGATKLLQLQVGLSLNLRIGFGASPALTASSKRRKCIKHNRETT